MYYFHKMQSNWLSTLVLGPEQKYRWGLLTIKLTLIIEFWLIIHCVYCTNVKVSILKVVVTLGNLESWIWLLIDFLYCCAIDYNFVKNLLHNPYQYFITRVQFWLFLAYCFWLQPHLCQLYHFNHLLSIGNVQTFG